MRERPLFLLACVFLTGLVHRRYEADVSYLVLACILGMDVFYGLKHKNVKKIAGRSIILLSAFLIGGVHMQREESFRDAYMSKITDGTKGTVFGEISKIEHTDYGVRMILSDVYIRLEEADIPCNKVLVYASVGHFQVGEIHKITGQLHTFETARNEGNFDARNYYQSQKIDFSISCIKSQLLEESSASLVHLLLNLKTQMEKVFINCMDTKTAGFFTGMILGDKTHLDEKLKELFTLTGISHILAISGLHVSIIGRGFYQQLRKSGIGFGAAGVLSAIVLVSYCFMVGNGMSAVRAVGMMLLFFLAQYVGRAYDMLNALGAMVLVLLWENPFLIEYSGFYFSVMALVGVGFVSKELSQIAAQPVREKKENKENKGLLMIKGIEKSLWTCTGITLTTLPVVAFCYFEIPLYASFVNFIVLPILTPVFCVAVIAALVGLWLPDVAYILLLPCSWVLGLYEWICTNVKHLPWASLISGKPSMIEVVVYYLVLFGGVWLIKSTRKKLFAMILCIICYAFMLFPSSKPCEITFLDVGQGDAVYISGGDGATYFIDGGSTSEDSVGEYRILPFLKAKGVSQIHYWFVSHADADHVSGVLEVIESGYEIGNLVVSKHAPMDESLSKLVALAESYGVRMLYMDAGECIVSSNVSFTCLYPWDGSQQDKNEASLVLEMEIKDGRKAFFAGDISSDTEHLLLARGVVDDVWLYKVSHHGSKYSNSSEILEVLQPEVCVVSCSKGNFYGHPHEEAIERMEAVEGELFYTMENGQVSFLLLK